MEYGKETSVGKCSKTPAIKESPAFLLDCVFYVGVEPLSKVFKSSYKGTKKDDFHSFFLIFLRFSKLILAL